MSTIHGKSGWSEGSDFTNNFISDLGPLLALFGEQVAKQFMSESMGWADSIIFAMGPLGIITAIVGAIRVGGPSWLKAIIGRARENRAVAEVELMSSTSHEVCELWNGQQIVRIMGSPEIRELIRIDKKAKARRSEGHAEMSSIFTTLEQAMKKEMVSKVKEESSFPWLSPPWKITQDFTPKLKTNTVCPEAQTSLSQQNPEILPRPEIQQTNGGHQPPSGSQKTHAPQNPMEKPVKKSAPNISLNIHDHSRRHELHVVAVVGTALQLFVLIYGGFATYHPQLKYQKEGSDIAVYAFPLTSIGTLFLVVGLLKNATVGDQEFDSYAIFAKDKRNIITTSRRNNDNDPSDPSKNGSSTSSEVLSSAGTVITLCGFFGQFIGLRSLHWSITLAQLGLTLIMAVLRAWVRRGLAKRPYIQLLPPKHEIDWLATRITHETCDLWRESGPSLTLPYWRKAWDKICMRQEPPKIAPEEPVWSRHCFDWDIMTGEDAHGYESLSVEIPSRRIGRMNQVVQSRKELGWLTKWPGSGRDYATSVTAAIDLVMNTLMSWDGEKWSGDVAEIEATLSLWLYKVREEEQANYDDNDKSAWLRSEMPSKRQGLRLLGKSTRSSRRDMKWWIGGGISRIFQVSMPSIAEDGMNTEGLDTISTKVLETITVENHCVVGIRDQDRASGPPISQSRSGSMIYKIQPFPEDLTTDLSSLDKNTKLVTPNPERGLVRVWDQEDSRFSLAVVSDAPIGLLFAQDMFSSFMWAVAKTASREQMAHLMGPATVQKAEDVTSTKNAAWKSFTLKNPILSKLVQGIQRTGLGSQEEIYLSIIPPLSANGRLPDPTAVVQSAREEAKKQELTGQLQRAGEVYLWTLHACMSFGHKHTVAIEASIAMTEFIRSISITAQDREHQSRIVESSKRLKEIRSRLAAVLIQSSSPPVLGMLARMYDLQCRDEGCNEWMLKTNTIFPNVHTLDLLNSDLLCRTKLHEAVIRGEKRLAHFQEHYASVYYNHLKTKDIFGWTPLHYAARLGDQKSFDMLLQSHADVNSTDIAGWTPLHYIIWARCVQPDI
ncbi:uncharacterized protein H6S33_001926 [Morchella sextelata]|uniref:uncharacterized protein n=1 Tax=Morchella sextelata TaxID=1174677 RepID=UPI001D0453A0|nr:uncharacterized protein H6S33_001926 [Morchella sextelata]KAH0607874.1 hypothetical protein H6S33_001926 [Morchella sextelata]